MQRALDRRIQQALDGEIPRDDLTRALAGELDDTEQLMGRVVQAIPEEPLPDLAPAVIASIRALRSSPTQSATAPPPLRATHAQSRPEAGRIRAAVGWLWHPRPLQWRPAYALAAAALLVAAVVASEFTGSRTEPPPAVAAVPAGAAQVFVQFRLEAPHANQVMLAGDFTQWNPAYVLSRSSTGVWSVVVPLKPGVHEYAFVIDGSDWVADPLAPSVSDGFGGVNSRLAVLTPDEPRPL